jgi:hypothetical protein
MNWVMNHLAKTEMEVQFIRLDFLASSVIFNFGFASSDQVRSDSSLFYFHHELCIFVLESLDGVHS